MADFFFFHNSDKILTTCPKGCASPITVASNQPINNNEDGFILIGEIINGKYIFYPTVHCLSSHYDSNFSCLFSVECKVTIQNQEISIKSPPFLVISQDNMKSSRRLKRARSEISGDPTFLSQ